MNGGNQVYVVDDEPLIASTLTAILIDYGYDATMFTDPLDVLAEVRPGAPAILVSDVTMPGITGIELAMRVLERCPGCRILLMTALDSIEALLASGGAGQYEFSVLRKPFHPTALFDAIHRLLHASQPSFADTSP
jgi:DNA-binding NtrC family response regulator